MVRDRLRCQTALNTQIVAKFREDLLLQCLCWDGRLRDCASGAQSRQPPLQRGPVVEMDGLLRSMVSQVALHHPFIEVAQFDSMACHPSQEIADHIEGAPSAGSGEPDLDEARRIQLDKTPVDTASEAPEQPAPAQILFRSRHRGLRS
jgi:hypothetical protein